MLVKSQPPWFLTFPSTRSSDAAHVHTEVKSDPSVGLLLHKKHIKAIWPVFWIGGLPAIVLFNGTLPVQELIDPGQGDKGWTDLL